MARRVVVGSLLLALVSCRGGTPRPVGPEERTAPAFSRRLPLSFESNLGQAPPEVKYLARNGSYGIFVTERESGSRAATRWRQRLGRSDGPGRRRASGDARWA